MKYNPDIALQILKAVEEHPEDDLRPKMILLPEIDENLYYFHSRLLSEAGYIRVYKLENRGYYWPRQITWDGVQFLEQFRNDSLWQRAKDVASEKGVGMALDTLLQIGKVLAGDMLKQIG